VRNLLAKLPERERVRQAYWQALDEAINEQNGRQRLGALIEELEKAGYTAAAKWLAEDLDARSSCICATRPDTAAGGDQPTCSSDRWARSSAAPR
jgi:Tfp pilus assembly protein PilW